MDNDDFKPTKHNNYVQEDEEEVPAKQAKPTLPTRAEKKDQGYSSDKRGSISDIENSERLTKEALDDIPIPVS